MFARPQIISSATSALVVPHLSTAASISTTSCHRQHSRLRRRYYATTTTNGHDQPRIGDSDDGRGHVWPNPPEGHSCPTPYQIFAMSRTQTYSKAHFYNLVKLYHPDRGEINAHHLTLPLHVRLERYRLIVAAHNILSDPSKRNAYDRLGVGWHGHSSSVAGSTGGQAGPFSYNWQDSDDPIWANATWEDWERFHAKREARESGEQPPQEPLIMSNTMFIMLVFAIVFAGSAVNLNRAKDNGQYFVDQRDIVHDRAAKELRKVRMEKQTMGNRNDRVEWFVRQREATLGVAGSDLAVMREEMADRVLPNRDVCRSEEVTQQEPSANG